MQMQGARVENEIAEYERLNLAAMEATRIVTEGLDIADEAGPAKNDLDIEDVETAPLPRLALPRWGEQYEATLKEETS